MSLEATPFFLRRQNACSPHPRKEAEAPNKPPIRWGIVIVRWQSADVRISRKPPRKAVLPEPPRPVGEVIRRIAPPCSRFKKERWVRAVLVLLV